MNSLGQAREISIQCWCTPKTEHLELDADITEEFAQQLCSWIEQSKILQEIIDKQQEAIDVAHKGLDELSLNMKEWLNAQEEECLTCSGTGQVEAYRGEPSQGTENIICSICKGTGYVQKESQKEGP